MTETTAPARPTSMQRVAPFYAKAHTLHNCPHEFTGRVTDVYMVGGTMLAVQMTLASKEAERYARLYPGQARRTRDGEIVNALLVVERRDLVATRDHIVADLPMLEAASAELPDGAIDRVRETVAAMTEALELPIERD